MVNALQCLIFHKFIQLRALDLKEKYSHNNANSFFPLYTCTCISKMEKLSTQAFLFCMRNWNLYKRLESILVLDQFLSINGAYREPETWLTVVWHGVAVAQLDLVVPDLHILVSLHTAGRLLSALELQDGTPTQVQRAKVKEQDQILSFIF